MSSTDLDIVSILAYNDFASCTSSSLPFPAVHRSNLLPPCSESDVDVPGDGVKLRNDSAYVSVGVTGCTLTDIVPVLYHALFTPDTEPMAAFG
jgi:hypothetical protein